MEYIEKFLGPFLLEDTSENNDKCCDKCKMRLNVPNGTLEGEEITCYDSNCPCHTPPQEAQPYNKIDHSHCWTKENPPCGLKGKHQCCLCGEPVPVDNEVTIENRSDPRQETKAEDGSTEPRKECDDSLAGSNIQEDLAGQINEGLERHFAEEEVDNHLQIENRTVANEEPWVAEFTHLVGVITNLYGTVPYGYTLINDFIQKTLEADRKAHASSILERVGKMEYSKEELQESYNRGLPNLHFAMVFANNKLSEVEALLREESNKGEI